MKNVHANWFFYCNAEREIHQFCLPLVYRFMTEVLNSLPSSLLHFASRHFRLLWIHPEIVCGSPFVAMASVTRPARGLSQLTSAILKAGVICDSKQFVFFRVLLCLHFFLLWRKRILNVQSFPTIRFKWRLVRGQPFPQKYVTLIVCVSYQNALHELCCPYK